MSREQVVLVTGASSGIGLAIAERLARNGFRVFGAARGSSEIGKYPAGVETVRLDVRDAASVRSCVETIVDRAGRIDALVNNAGYALIGSIEETSIEEAKQLFETNFFGVLRMSAAVLPLMREQNYGRILNIGSIVGFVPAPYQGIYAASKHALEGYSESLDYEVRDFGVRVSVVEPGFTRTSIFQNAPVVTRPLDIYAQLRNRVTESVNRNIANGVDPGRVASVVLRAITSRSPDARYPVGKEARMIGVLRKFLPSGLFERGLRKQFGLTMPDVSILQLTRERNHIEHQQSQQFR
ncbi:MAG TPA: oxidoreductase [Bryobacteraceae bacterium]|jgi:short-subunit dehydrogenase|nr:oxidoreductase [Bryobacteraceae bacterium]